LFYFAPGGANPSFTPVAVVASLRQSDPDYSRGSRTTVWTCLSLESSPRKDFKVLGIIPGNLFRVGGRVCRIVGDGYVEHEQVFLLSGITRTVSESGFQKSNLNENPPRSLPIRFFLEALPRAGFAD